MKNNPFESADLAFQNYKKLNPSGTYAQFSVANQLAYVKRGNLHPTLGKSTLKYDDFWKAGASDFERYLRLLNIKPNSKVVDYGCGSLRLGAHLIKFLEPDCYFGIDVTTDFIEMGRESIGNTLINNKRPLFGAISEKVLLEATKFGADFVISTACAFQIHPEEKNKYIIDLKMLASKESCIICFDTKIAEEKFRYRTSGYVWTIDYYKENFKPLVLQVQHKIKDHREQERNFEAKILIFCHDGACLTGLPESSTAQADTSKPSISQLTQISIDETFEKLMQTGIMKDVSLSTNQPRALAHTLTAKQRETIRQFATIEPLVLSSFKDLAEPEKVEDAVSLRVCNSNSVEIFVSSSILDFIVDIERAIQSAARVLRPGGYAIFRIKKQRLTDGDAPPCIAYKVVPETFGLSKDVNMVSMKISRGWLYGSIGKAGLEAAHHRLHSNATGDTVEWFVGRKPHGANDNISTDVDVAPIVHTFKCEVCGHDFGEIYKGIPSCPGCKSQPRTRTIVKLMSELGKELSGNIPASDKVLLAFGMNSAEETVLVPSYFGHAASVSLYGSYRSGHVTGVDVRDLSRYDAESYDGVFGSLLFDYFEEHEKALKEISRVLKKGGVFITTILGARLTSCIDSPPKRTSIIKKRDGYFEYIPDGVEMPSVNVGSAWFAEAMNRACLKAKIVNIVDNFTAERVTWFVGTKV